MTYTVDHTQDEDGRDRFFIVNEQGDWIGEPFDTEDLAIAAIPKAICNTCGAPKGLQCVGESCNNNCGGKVIANDQEGL